MNSPLLLDIDLPGGTRLLVAPLPAELPRGTRQEASRAAVAGLLRHALGPDVCLDHREDGAPLLSSHPGLHVTISHSRHYAAVALGPERLGLDVEEPREQLRRVAPRVLSEEETAKFRDLSQLLRAWTVKEALYKLHPGAEACDFRSNMSVDPPTVTGHRARIIKEMDLTEPPAHLTLLGDA